MKTGIELIAEERQRQIDVEGWTPEHDDQHTAGELADASAVYAAPAMYRNIWPWRASWWKPSPNNRIKELAKSGALIAAEIDRLQRKAAKEGGKQ